MTRRENAVLAAPILYLKNTCLKGHLGTIQHGNFGNDSAQDFGNDSAWLRRQKKAQNVSTNRVFFGLDSGSINSTESYRVPGTRNPRPCSLSAHLGGATLPVFWVMYIAHCMIFNFARFLRWRKHPKIASVMQDDGR